MESVVISAGYLGGIAHWGSFVRAKGGVLVTVLLQPAGSLLERFLGCCRNLARQRVRIDYAAAPENSLGAIENWPN
ncbi:hypothetical protein AAE026_17280 [Bradyrhizobium sp. DN5]|uniref:hypothetical protein n=1 Tax=Bradyrhizobium sp. DN5 TaxID=3056950 RepID=UPI00352313A3